MSAELLQAGDTLIAIHRGAEHQAIVLDDGLIKLAGGEPFTSLSSAAAYAKRTKSANGWEFWQLQKRRERRPLKELRDELIRGER
jgi:Restriction Enzyme Adenine Methylase Associated